MKHAARGVVFIALAAMAGVTAWAFQHELAGEQCRSIIVGDTQYITCTRTRPAPSRGAE
jgi:hypothetical protein